MLLKEEKNIFDAIANFMKSSDMPKFPISKTKKIKVPYFTNVRIKDESTNKTWTHKDRMAREIVQVYFDILRNKSNNKDISPLPHFSIISAWSAALAIQTQLKKYTLPNLKILVDKKTDKKVLKTLASIGCEVHMTDLGKKQLSHEDILKFTNNPDGFDITSNKWFDPDIRFYDRLAYEVLNTNPDYVFIPFGTGQLYENILNIAKNILISNNKDKVYIGDKKKIKDINFIWATTNNSKSKAVKLFAPFRPFTTVTSEWVRLYAKKWYCWKESKIIEVNEKFIQSAYDILKKNKIASEYSGAAGLWLLYQMQNKIPKNSKILIINTGKAKI